MVQGMTSTKRFVVRTAMVTSATIATILGSQSLAAFDQANKAATTEPLFSTEPSNTTIVLPVESSQDAPAVAPNIVILRHQGSEQRTSVSANSVTQPNPIVPPNPVQIAPPQPVIQQVTAPSVPRTRSSR